MTDESNNQDVVRIYNGILLSHKNEIMTFAALWMNIEIVTLGKAEKDKYMISLIRRILKMVQIK